MKTKRKLTFLLAMAMVLSIFGYVFASTGFSDVTNVWCETYVADLVNRKIVDGYSDGLYHPQDAVTRGAVAKMLLLSMKSAGSGIDVSTKNAPFTDMKGNWAEQYVTPLTGIKVILPSEYPNGYGSGTAMSRLETIKAIVRAYLYAHPEDQLGTDVTLDFTDSNQISKEDAPFVKKGVDLGIISGYEDGSFKPGASIQRSTAAAMMSRFIQAVGKISDKLGAGSENRVDGKLPEPADKAPEIQNVEWVLKPQIVIKEQNELRENFSEFSKDGMSCYWTNRGHDNPTFIDLQGNTHQFKGVSDVGEFVGGVAPAMDTKTGKCGYINFAGNWVVKPIFVGTDAYKTLYLQDGTSGIYGTVKKDDGIWYPITTEYTVLPEDLLYKVDLYKTYGDIEVPVSKDGYDVIPEHTKDGLFKIEKHMGEYSEEGSYFGFCDRDGNTIVAPTYKMPPLQNLHSTYLSAEIYDDCILMTHKISATWTCIKDIYDGKTGKLLYSYYNMDEFGQPSKYLKNYGQGLFAFGNGNSAIGQLYGYMKPDGTEVIPPVFEKTQAFSNGYAWVNYQGQWGIIRLPK